MSEKLGDPQGQLKVTETDWETTPELAAAASEQLAAWNALSEEERSNWNHNQVFHGLSNNTTKCEREHKWDFGPGMTGDLGGQVPVEGEGLLDGRPWYFRARYNTWSFDWADAPDTEPVYVNLGYEPGVHYEQPYKVGDRFAAGYMSLDEAFELICKARDILRHDHTWAEDTDPKLKSVLRCVCGAQRVKAAALEDRLVKRTRRQAVRPLEDSAELTD